jgi:hypothetical protein
MSDVFNHNLQIFPAVPFVERKATGDIVGLIGMAAE